MTGLRKYSDDQARDEHGMWTSGSGGTGAGSAWASLPADEDYGYHATTNDRLADIAGEGYLQVHRPDHGTEQEAWPDGGEENRAYFARSPQSAASFIPEGGKPVLLRVRRDVGMRRESGTGDMFTRKRVAIDQIEALGADGKWRGVASLRKYSDDQERAEDGKWTAGGGGGAGGGEVVFRGAPTPEFGLGHFSATFVSADQKSAAQYGETHRYQVKPGARLLSIENANQLVLEHAAKTGEIESATDDLDDLEIEELAANRFMFPDDSWVKFLKRRGYDGINIGKDRAYFEPAAWLTPLQKEDEMAEGLAKYSDDQERAEDGKWTAGGGGGGGGGTAFSHADGTPRGAPNMPVGSKVSIAGEGSATVSSISSNGQYYSLRSGDGDDLGSYPVHQIAPHGAPAPSKAADKALGYQGWKHEGNGLYSHPDMPGHTVRVGAAGTGGRQHGPQGRTLTYTAWEHRSPDGRVIGDRGVEALEYHTGAALRRGRVKKYSDDQERAEDGKWTSGGGGAGGGGGRMFPDGGLSEGLRAEGLDEVADVVENARSMRVGPDFDTTGIKETAEGHGSVIARRALQSGLSDEQMQNVRRRTGTALENSIGEQAHDVGKRNSHTFGNEARVGFERAFDRELARGASRSAERMSASLGSNADSAAAGEVFQERHGSAVQILGPHGSGGRMVRVRDHVGRETVARRGDLLPVDPRDEGTMRAARRMGVRKAGPSLSDVHSQGAMRKKRPASREYLEQLLRASADLLPKWIRDELHRVAMPASGGRAKAARLAQMREAQARLAPPALGLPPEVAVAKGIVAFQHAAGGGLQLRVGGERFGNKLLLDTTGLWRPLTKAATDAGTPMDYAADAPDGSEPLRYDLILRRADPPQREDEQALEDDELAEEEAEDDGLPEDLDFSHEGGAAEDLGVGPGLHLISKAADRQLVTGVVFEPEAEDSQGDITGAAEIEKACHQFLADYRTRRTRLRLQHDRDLSDAEAVLVENYIAPVDMRIGGQRVTKGTWLQTWHLKWAPLWDAVKDGTLTGFSFGGVGTRTQA